MAVGLGTNFWSTISVTFPASDLGTPTVYVHYGVKKVTVNAPDSLAFSQTSNIDCGDWSQFIPQYLYDDCRKQARAGNAALAMGVAAEVVLTLATAAFAYRSIYVNSTRARLFAITTAIVAGAFGAIGVVLYRIISPNLAAALSSTPELKGFDCSEKLDKSFALFITGAILAAFMGILCAVFVQDDSKAPSRPINAPARAATVVNVKDSDRPFSALTDHDEDDVGPPGTPPVRT